MQIKPIGALTTLEIRDLASYAAERGERIKDVNPFPRGSAARMVFTRVFAARALELRPFAVDRLGIHLADKYESSHV